MTASGGSIESARLVVSQNRGLTQFRRRLSLEHSATATMNAQQPSRVDPEKFLARFAAGDDILCLRLFGRACCRRIWQLLPEASRQAVEVCERYEIGQAAEAEYTSAVELALFTRGQLRSGRSCPPFLRRSSQKDNRSLEAASIWAAGAASNACRGNWTAAAELAAHAAACLSGDHEAAYRQERQAQCKLFVATSASQSA